MNQHTRHCEHRQDQEHSHQPGHGRKPYRGQRLRVLQARHRYDGLDATLEPLPGDEELLDHLAAADPHNRHTEDYLAIEAWLTAAYTARRGCYADPLAHAQSALPGLVRERAAWLYACSNANPPDTGDHPHTCPWGEHRFWARHAFERSLELERARWDAFCQNQSCPDENTR
ncbi:hypothetical protein [Kitasatospora sp. NPDC004272]